MKNLVARVASLAATAHARAFLFAVAVVGVLTCSAGQASAQTGTVFPTGVPKIVEPTTVLDAATDLLGVLALPFILTSLGLMALYMIWRFGKRIVGGGA